MRWRRTKENLVGMHTHEGIEHLEYLEANDEDKSVLWLHSIHHHQRRPDVKYSMKVTGTFQDPLDRQIMEKIQIQNFKGPVLMNRRSEMGGVRVERMQYRRCHLRGGAEATRLGCASNNQTLRRFQFGGLTRLPAGRGSN